MVFSAMGLFLPLLSLAQTFDSTVPTVNVFDKQGVRNILEGFVRWFAGILVVVGIFMILWAAFRYMTAGGDDDKVSSAKNTLIYGLVGIGIAILAFGVWRLVYSFLS